MHQLLLLRHANAAAAPPGLPDHARPLTAVGRAAAGAMGRAMRRLGLQPDLVLVSSARRTRRRVARPRRAGARAGGGGGGGARPPGAPRRVWLPSTGAYSYCALGP